MSRGKTSPCRFAAAIVSFLVLLLAVPAADGQSVTGRVSGTVADASGAVLVGATVRLTNDVSKQAREFKTDQNGGFVFTNVMPGTYSVHITQPGFKAYDQKGVSVAPNESVALHEIRLPVGEVTSTVEVVAQAAHVATDNSDRTVLIDPNQIENTPIRGRDFLGLLRTLPGVLDTAFRDAPGWNSAIPEVNGGQTGQFLVTLDGIVNQDSGYMPYTGFNTGGYLAPSVDAIGQVTVLISHFNAEYGSRSGGQMNVTVKQGTRQFHGTVYDFLRHEMFNANEWFSNANRAAKPRYRFQNPGGTIGGPLIIPGTRFNQSRTRLFFFFSEDYLRRYLPGALTGLNMPTAAERSGDFSQTVTTTGVLIPIYDPAEYPRKAAFPGNRIPASRINPAGQAILNLFPLPDPAKTDPTGRRQYNNQFQFNRWQPREDRILRLDYTLGPKTVSYLRLIQDYQADKGVGSLLGATGTWGQLPTTYGIQSAGAVITVIHTISPTLVNEFTWGVNRGHQTVTADDLDRLAQNQLPALKDSSGKQVTLPKFYANNPSGLLPGFSFGTSNPISAGQGITAAPNFGWDSRFPFFGTDTVQNLTNKLSWIRRGHVVKAGVYYEHGSRNVPTVNGSKYMGQFYFGSDTGNPNDSGYGYSNALLGTVQCYIESNSRPLNHALYQQFEWFVQDNWKISRRVTLDLGIRFQLVGPTKSLGSNMAVFDMSLYDAAKTPQLLWPAMVNGTRVARNPLTGQTYPYNLRGSFAPGSGTPFVGMHTYKDSYFRMQPPHPGPRLGFAWDMLGNGKMALRGGFGVYYDRSTDADTVGALAGAPPGFQNQTVYSTTIAELLTTQAFVNPQDVYSSYRDLKQPRVYSWSFGIQRAVASGIVLDVAYVGNTVRHGFSRQANQDANAVPPLTTWSPTTGLKPAATDPTTGTVLPINYLRPIQGMGAIYLITDFRNSNYHSMQTQLRRRYGKRLQFGVSWTWQKTHTYSNRMQSVRDRIFYTPSGRRHNVTSNWTYRIPDGSRVWKNVLTKGALDGWHINGIATFLTGNAATVSMGVSSAPAGYPTGTPSPSYPFRPQMTGDLWLPEGSAPPANIDRRLYYPLNPASFTLPPLTSFGLGNTPPVLFFGPGWITFDTSLFKDFRLGSEKRILEFRAEAYNLLNHMSPSNPNASLSINYNTLRNTNASFGAIQSSQSQARRMAVALKVRF